MKTSKSNSFGIMLRAYRLCYVNAPRHGCFLRVQAGSQGTWRVEVVPPELRYLKRGPGHFRVGGNGDELMQSSPALDAIQNPSSPITMILNDDGSDCQVEPKEQPQ